MNGFGNVVEDQYHTPRVCKKCGGVMIFKGVGEYRCEDCGEEDYDDYGKVRRYIEENRGATAAQAETATGVSQRSIRQMLKEGRLEVAPNSKVALRCEACGKSIRFGRFCPACETSYHRGIEDEERERKKKNLQGVALGQKTDEGQKRFVRNSGS